MYSSYCKNVVQFGSLREQPIPAYIIDDKHQHIRQRVVNAKTFKWKLELERVVNCIEQKKICVAQLNIDTGNMVKSNHQEGIKLDSSDKLLSLIMKTTKAKSTNYNIIVSCRVDLDALTFPSNKGVYCLIVIRASEIVNRKKDLSVKIGNKIKMKLVFDSQDWYQKQDMPDKIQNLLMALTKQLIVKDKIYIYGNHGGAWYYSKEKLKTTYQVEEDANVRTINVYTNYVDYQNTQRPIPTLQQEQRKQQKKMNVDDENEDEQKEESDEEDIDMLIYEESEEKKQNDTEVYQLDVGADSYRNVWSQQFEEEISKEIYEFMSQSSEELNKHGKFEDKRKSHVHRGKFWAANGKYWYKGDKMELGELYSKVMKVAKGVRLFDKSIPGCFEKLKNKLMKTKVMEEKPDCLACNIYTEGSSSIENHNEADRYRKVLHITFTSNNPRIITYLSINQCELHGTAEVNLRSEHAEIVKFDSLVSFILCFFMLLMFVTLCSGKVLYERTTSSWNRSNKS